MTPEPKAIIGALSVEQTEFKLNRILHKQWNKRELVPIGNSESSHSGVSSTLTSNMTPLLWKHLRRTGEYCRRAE